MCSSRSSVSEEHLMGPSMSVCLSVCRAFPAAIGNVHGWGNFCATMARGHCLNTLLRNNDLRPH
jgi:hypothetical protein